MNCRSGKLIRAIRSVFNAYDRGPERRRIVPSIRTIRAWLSWPSEEIARKAAGKQAAIGEMDFNVLSGSLVSRILSAIHMGK